MPGAYRAEDLLSLCNEMAVDIVIQRLWRILVEPRRKEVFRISIVDRSKNIGSIEEIEREKC